MSPETPLTPAPAAELLPEPDAAGEPAPVSETDGASEAPRSAQGRADTDEIERLVERIRTLDAERDEFLHLLIGATSGPMGRLGIRWHRFAERHQWARILTSRPTRTLWLIVTLRKPGFIRVNPLFDADYYAQRYPDVPRGKRKAWWHYRRHGVKEGRDPNPWFDTRWYQESYPDVAHGRINPLDHYLDYGWRESREPSQLFDGFDYLRHHPECVVLAMNPLLHFMRYGERSSGEVARPRHRWTMTEGSSAAGRTMAYYRRYGARRTAARITEVLRSPAGSDIVGDAGVLAVSEQVRPEAIHAHVDSPVEGSIEGAAAFVLSGWACSTAGLESVNVYLGSRFIGPATIGQPRPDVAKAFPGVAGSGSSGFTLRIPLDEVEPGPEHLQVILRDLEGATRVIPRGFQRVAPEAAYHEFYERSLPTPEEVLAMQREVAKSRSSPRIHLCLIAGGSADRDVRASIRSIARQSYPAWTCSVLTEGSRVPGVWALIRETATDEHRWSVVARARDLLAASPSKSRFVGFLHAGETLAPEALFSHAAEAAADGATLVYSDHDSVEDTGRHVDPWFVWDWSPDRLLAQDYVGGFYLARDSRTFRSLVLECIIGSPGSWRYDLLLRLTDSDAGIRHVSKVLWSAPADRVGDGANPDAELAAVSSAIRRRGLDAEVETIGTGSGHPLRRVRWPLVSEPRVSIVIPTTGRIDLVSETLDGLRRTEYGDMEVIFLDNSRGANPDGIAKLRSEDVTVLERNEPFNWSKLSNDGARAASGDLLLFMNDDLEVSDPAWLRELVRHAIRPTVGAVGSLLLYPDDRIQHAGVFLVDRGGGAVHLLRGVPHDGGAYLSLDRVTRETSAVTGACLLVRREAFESVGGFDADLAVIGNDVDLCLRLRRAGYQTLWTPESVLVHHESASRSGISYLPDEARVWRRWGDLLSEGDPFYNGNLARGRTDCSLDWSSVAGRRDPDLSANGEDGVNLVGYIRAEMGVGEAARGLAHALHDAEIPFIVIDHAAGNPARMSDSRWIHKIAPRPRYGTNILHINADVLPSALDLLPDGLRDGRRNIGYWTWELQEFPEAWVASFDLVDEVWVPSAFVREAVTKRAAVPVSILPHAICDIGGPFLDRSHFRVPNDRFQFLMTYDMHSVRERKNPEGALEAFRRAFADPNVPVSLVVKVNNADANELSILRKDIGGDPRIHLIGGTLSRHEMDSLMACSDALVSLHRSEGFGLQLAEAMSLAKPVIATGWSGNMDFMSEANAICVPYDLVELDKPYGPYPAGQRWADPDLDYAATSMRALVLDPSIGDALGRVAQATIRERLDPQVVGRLLVDLLDHPPGMRGASPE